MRDWGIEQKWMSILLPLLLLYNGTCILEFLEELLFLKKQKKKERKKKEQESA